MPVQRQAPQPTARIHKGAKSHCSCQEWNYSGCWQHAQPKNAPHRKCGTAASVDSMRSGKPFADARPAQRTESTGWWGAQDADEGVSLVAFAAHTRGW